MLQACIQIANSSNPDYKNYAKLKKINEEMDKDKHSSESFLISKFLEISREIMNNKLYKDKNLDYFGNLRIELKKQIKFQSHL